MTKLYQDEIILPSMGLLYDGAIPGGKMIISMMGTKEEKLLAGSRVGAEKLISKVIKSVTVEPKVFEPKDLLMLDRLFVLIKLRLLSFPGVPYGFRYNCSTCGQAGKHEMDLAELTINYMDESFTEPFEVLLPYSEQIVYLKLLRGRDEESITDEVKRLTIKNQLPDGDASYQLRLERYISHTDKFEANDYYAKSEFINNLTSMDTLTIRDAYDNIKYGVDMEIMITCKSCGDDFMTPLPFNEEFFRPKLRKHNS